MDAMNGNTYYWQEAIEKEGFASPNDGVFWVQATKQMTVDDFDGDLQCHAGSSPQQG